MSYHSGKMGMAECLAFVFMMTFTRTFLTAPSRVLAEQANLSWLSVLLTGIAAMVMLLLLNRAFRGHSGDLLDLAEDYLGRPAKWIIGLFYISMFFTDATLLTRQYAENTLLTALHETEFTLLLLIYGLAIVIILRIGLEPICRTAYIIMPAGIAGLIIVLLMLMPTYDFYELLPWQGKGLGVLVSKSLLEGGSNAACVAPAILSPTFHNSKTWMSGSLFGLGISVAVKVMTAFVFLIVVGVSVGQEKVLPFYEMARLVYLGRFFQRVEALFIVLWVIFGILTIAMNLYVGLYLSTRLLKLETMHPLIPTTVILIVSLASLPTDVTAVIQIEVQMLRTMFNVGLYGIPGVLFLASLWQGTKKRRKPPCSAS
ncbi:MAG: hypothetical protein K0Q77_1275 [Anaerosporomusa subterranea]|jgi:spore germination protein (amino acid permease)|nr:hypothetical protein [Anaerosporomusa subterranea]